MKPVFIIAIVAVAMIGMMVPSVFAQPTDRCANLNPGALLMDCDLHGMDLSKKDLSGANLSGASVLLTYSKDTNYENVIITQDTKTDSCFSRGLFDRVICYFYRTITPESPPFYEHFQKLPTGFQFEN